MGEAMDLSALLVFMGALFVAAASPGPAVAAIVARVLARGPSGAVAFCAGLAIGDIVWLVCAVLGLAVMAQTFQGLFVVIKYCGAAYLLFLAWKLWTAPVGDTRPEAALDAGSVRLFLAGLAVTLGNPKVMIFYLALVPNIVDLAHLSALGLAELSMVVLVVLTIVFGAYILLAVRARRMLSSPRLVRAVNRGTGAVIASAAVAIATR